MGLSRKLRCLGQDGPKRTGLMQSRAHRVKQLPVTLTNRAKGGGVNEPSAPGVPEKRAAAVDLGASRVGLAVADELGWMAHPRPFLDGKNRKALLRALRRLVQSDGVGHFLVGLPRNLDGSEGPGARRARQFGRELAVETGCTVEMVDERLSTVQAQARLHEQGLDIRKSRSKIDSASAAILLQAWLDARRHASQEERP